MIIADYHTHSSFSSDSEASMEEMTEKAISLGLKILCFTDHMDYDFPNKYGLSFVFDPEAYFSKLEEISEKYKKHIKVLKGIELGLQPYLAPRYRQLVSQYDFDFIIGSSHLVDQIDPYVPEYWKDITEEEGLTRYFQTIIDNVRAFTEFQVYGHLDYAVRYAPSKNKNYNYETYKDIIDELLKTILDAGKAIEINTAGYKYGLDFAHPHTKIIKRYREMGGEIITIGSDGHCPEHMAYDFHRAEEMLLSLGFKYYAVYEKRQPSFVRLG